VSVRRALILLADIATVGVILYLWQHVSERQVLSVSRPSDVWTALRTWLQTPVLRGYIPTTLKEAALGFILALTVAVVAATVLASSRALADFCAPFIAVLNAVPKIALAPAFLLVFGIGLSSKVYFIAAAIFFIPFYSLFRALTTIDPDFIDNARMLGARRRWLVWDVYAPAVIGVTVSSLRVTAAFALLGAVVSELIASQSGIGYEINAAQGSFQVQFVVAGVILVALIAFVVDRFLVFFERRFSSWRIPA
jgi:NitT/TauT family transport system permease protein